MKRIIYLSLFLLVGFNAQSQHLKTEEIKDQFDYWNTKINVDWYPEPQNEKRIFFDYKKDTIIVNEYLWYLRKTSESEPPDTPHVFCHTYILPIHKIKEFSYGELTQKFIPVQEEPTFRIFYPNIPYKKISKLTGKSVEELKSSGNKNFYKYFDYLEKEDIGRGDTFNRSLYVSYRAYGATTIEAKMSAKYIDSLNLFIESVINQSALDVEENILTDCPDIDSIETFKMNIIDEIPVITQIPEFSYGYNNVDLSNKVIVNNKTNLDSVLNELFIEKIGREKFKSNQYRIFEIYMVINKDNEIENLFFTHELFWYLQEEGNDSQYQMLNKNSLTEIEMAKSMLGFMQYDEIEMLKSIITSQKWEAGKCGGKQVNTLVSITLNDLTIDSDNR